MKRAMIAMSGGVDSSVAALLMQQAGYDCTGVTMRLFRAPGMERASQKSCCSDADEEDLMYAGSWASRLSLSAVPKSLKKQSFKTLSGSMKSDGRRIHASSAIAA